MARMLAMVLTAIMIILFFQFIPNLNTPADVVGDLMKLATGEITTSDFWDDLFDITTGRLLLLVGAAAGTIFAGFFAKGQLENFIILGFIVTILSALVGTFVGVMGWVGDPSIFATEWVWVGNTIKILMGLFIVGYIITMVEFFRGNV